MGKLKYIQESKWFQEAREVGVKALDREYHRTMDEAIIRALGEKSMLKVEAGGRGSREGASL